MATSKTFKSPGLDAWMGDGKPILFTQISIWASGKLSIFLPKFFFLLARCTLLGNYSYLSQCGVDTSMRELLNFILSWEIFTSMLLLKLRWFWGHKAHSVVQARILAHLPSKRSSMVRQWTPAPTSKASTTFANYPSSHASPLHFAVTVYFRWWRILLTSPSCWVFFHSS